MKNESIRVSLALHGIVDRITIGTLPAATRKNSFIINDIPTDMQVNADEHMLAAVFGSLLNTVINHSCNCCIRISAKLYGQIVLVNLKESNAVNGQAFAGSLRQIQQLAERIGGTVSINSDRTRETTILFSFVNNLSLAA